MSLSLTEALRLCADGRAEYAQSLVDMPAKEKEYEFLMGQSGAFAAASSIVEIGTQEAIYGLIADAVPSWRWPPEVHDYVMRDNPYHKPHKEQDIHG